MKNMDAEAGFTFEFEDPQDDAFVVTQGKRSGKVRGFRVQALTPGLVVVRLINSRDTISPLVSLVLPETVLINFAVEVLRAAGAEGIRAAAEDPRATALELFSLGMYVDKPDVEVEVL